MKKKRLTNNIMKFLLTLPILGTEDFKITVGFAGSNAIVKSADTVKRNFSVPFSFLVE
jgi:hypothetical protein